MCSTSLCVDSATRSALLIQARILVERAETTQAAARLREYLAKPGVSKRVEAARWLQMLLDAETH